MILNLATLKNSFGQSPVTANCNGAIEKITSNTCEFTPHTYEATQNEHWIYFTATSQNKKIVFNQLNNDNSQFIIIARAELFSGTCAGLISDTTLFNPYYDSTYTLNNLIIGNTYYLRVRRDIITECSGGCADGKGFELCLRLVDAPCLGWSTQLLVSPGYTNWGICDNTAGAVCNISILPCEEFCFFVDCIANFPGGEITYIMNPFEPLYNYWIEGTNPILPICIYGYNLTPGSFYQFSASIEQPDGSTTVLDVNLTLAVQPTTNAYDAVTSNSFCTYQDLINATIQSNYLTSFYIDGNYIDFGNIVDFEAFFNNLSIGTHSICSEFVNECNEYSQFCEDFEINLCAPIFNATINCNEVSISNLTPFQSSYVSWYWNFGDGTYSNSANPGTHVYPSPGTYTITLTVENNVGDFFTVTQIVTPLFGAQMTLSLPASSCCTSPIISVNDDYTNYDWDIQPTVLLTGTGNTINPAFDPNTSYTVCVTAIDQLNGCPVSACGEVNPCCGFNTTLVPVTPTTSANHTIGNTYFTQNCGTETVSNLIANFGWSSTMSNKTIVLRNDLIVDTDISFDLCLIRVDEDKKIIMQNISPSLSTTLTIEKSQATNACDFLWQGIILDNPLCTLKVLNGTKIMQAKSSINASNGAPVFIEESELKNNYKNILLSDFNGIYPFSIRTSTIQGTNFGMLPPHSSDFLPYSGVEINNVKEVNIGIDFSSTYINQFKKLRYGIVSNSSNVNIYNNKFNDIKVNVPFSNLINNTLSMAIWARNGYSPGTSQFINVGNTGVNQKNYFTDCWKGVQVEGSMSTSIKGNEFKNMTITNIYTRNTIGKSISVQNNSMNGKFGIGVLCVNFIKSVININDNLIDESNAYNHQTSYLNTGIWLANVISTVSNYNITNNQIYRCENGIIADAVPTVIIKNNSIIYQRNNLQMLNTGRMHRGIQLKNSERAEITLNTISRTNPNPANNGTSATTAILRGISVELSEESYVHDNNIKQMGYGLYWRGYCFNSTISCNIMEKCFSGIYFEDAEIGHQGNQNKPSGNYWVNNINTLARIDGTINTSNLPTTKWYADDITNPLSITNPNPINIPVTDIIALLANGSANCQISPGGTNPGPMTLTNREMLFGSIVRDEKQFINYSDEFKQFNRKYLYNVLKNNPSWINLGGADDSDYLTFFTNVSLENEALMVSSNELISDTNFVSAITVNNSLIPIMIPESNHKLVTEIFLSTWAQGIEIDSSQFSILENIACQNPIIGGSAVYGARVMIGLDYECANGANKSIWEDEDFSDSINEPYVTIIPNPSNGKFIVNYEQLEFKNGNIQIFDLTGKCILELKLNECGYSNLDMSELSEGIYHYLIYTDDIAPFIGKIILVK